MRGRVCSPRIGVSSVLSSRHVVSRVAGRDFDLERVYVRGDAVRCNLHSRKFEYNTWKATAESA